MPKFYNVSSWWEMSDYLKAAFDQIVNWILPGSYLISDKKRHQKIDLT